MTREWQRLAEVVERTADKVLMTLSHYTTEPAAKHLSKTQPLLAAKLYLALGLRLVVAKKSQSYGVALENLEKARDLLIKQGKTDTWQNVIATVRKEHSRKSSFMPGFERLVLGPTRGEPSFLERARAKWGPKRA